ncbi:PRA1 family protein 3 [Lamellibrachia satsuma]|nr:PRA1 family protein 3 [Lamellibrachia satsuma]
MADVELAPLRPMNDFLLQGARFQVPNFKDTEAWTNRVLNNLLYYQTNYFLTALVTFLVVGVVHPVQMIFGCVAVAAVFAAFVYASNNQSEIRRLKRKHPSLSIVIVMLGGYVLIYLFGSVLVFLFGIALPMLVVLIHATLRMRNFKNKLSNKIEFVGLKRTPMGLLLEALGQEQEAGS